MEPKLSWTYDQSLDCEVAYHKGYRIRAVHDDSPENPFEDQDGYWPMVVRYERSIKNYDKVPGPGPMAVLDRFTDGQIVHDQKAIAVAVGPENLNDVRYHMGDMLLEDGDAPKWITDADVLRDWFGDGLDNVHDSEKFDVWEKLYDLLGIPCLNTSSRGYSQGDYAELLIVAAPEAQEQLRSKPEDMTDEEWKAPLDEDMDSQAKLYGYWAWGDCYGFIIEKPVFDEDGEIEDWVAACDHNSCWGYYGPDHDKSGLEEAALESVPDETLICPDDGNYLAEDGVCGFCGNVPVTSRDNEEAV